MAKHSRKRQRLSKDGDSKPMPLGSVISIHDDDKDEEERRLESLLFGTPYVPTAGKSTEKNVLLVQDDEDDAVAEIGKELDNLQDDDLFFVDEGANASGSHRASATTTTSNESDVESGLDADEDEAEQEDDVSDNDDDDKEDEDYTNAFPAPPSPSGSSTTLDHPPKPSKKQQPKAASTSAWHDPDDSTLKVSLLSNRLRKLRDGPDEDEVDGKDYERRLRRQFERINPAPEWARKHKRPKVGDGDNDGDDEVANLLSSTGGVLAGVQMTRHKTIMQGNIDIERLRDANQAAKAEGRIESVQFHPSPQVPVMVTASSDRRARLYTVDGHTNPHLLTLHIATTPLRHATFHPGGSTLLLAGPRPFYHVHDLQSGATIRSTRGLWGTSFTSSDSPPSLENATFSPSGDLLAISARRGVVHLVDWRSGGAGGVGQVVNSIKANSPIKSMWWSGGASNSNELMTLGADCQVYVWDIRTGSGDNKCIRRFTDDGAFGSSILAGDRTGKYLAVGSTSGLVNVYGSDAATSLSSLPGVNPKPLKTIQNLTTKISTIRFNHDSQLLALASSDKNGAMRLIHLPSLTSFANWPTSNTPLGHVSAIDFSTGSEYIAIGNTKGKVLLYHLKDFSAS